MTAHPRLDPRTGEMVFFAYSLFAPYLRYHVVDADGALVHSVDIDLPRPGDDARLRHHRAPTPCSSTRPIVFDMENLGKGPLVRWMPENGTRIGVMPRMGGADDLTWYEIENGHVQHFWNGWADGDRIEFSGSRFAAPNFGIDGTAELDERVAGNRGRLARRATGSTWRPAPPAGSRWTTSAATSTASTTTTTACARTSSTCRRSWPRAAPSATSTPS